MTPHPASLDPEVIHKECEVRFTRRSGPGGQNRNKVETAVILTHRPTGLVAEASERRTQGENLQAALFRLRLLLALKLRCPVKVEEPSSPLWQGRCRGGKIVLNPSHDDFPGILAEALDRLAACDDDPRLASAALGCSTSQLVKLLKDEPRALQALNERRQARGLHRLV